MRVFGLLLLSMSSACSLSAQCILSNPSFEITGTTGQVFAGWNEFGVTSASMDAIHGSSAARLNGRNDGQWSMTAFWQALDCSEGEQWDIQGWVRPSLELPLTGQSIALVNVEWRDGAEALIDYSSFIVADAASLPGEYGEFTLLSPSAPAGTVSIRLLAGLLQSPDEPISMVDYDLLSFYSTSAPHMDGMQWDDFPDARVLSFSDRSWRVKGSGWYGPGSNFFSHLPEHVWVDEQDRLHMTLQETAGIWRSTEVTLIEALGYGDYIFTTRGALDQLDPQAVLGLFLWQYGPCWDSSYSWWNPYNEIDVEFSRWGNPANEIGQFVAQPWDWEGNIHRFSASFGESELSSHAFRWLSDRVEFRSWLGGPDAESAETLLHEWSYFGPHVPRPEQPRVHINLWKLGGSPASMQEVLVEQFNFLPLQTAMNPIEDLSIHSNGPWIQLLWSDAVGASLYHIMESTAAYGPWTAIGSTGENHFEVDRMSGSRFYRITWE